MRSSLNLSINMTDEYNATVMEDVNILDKRSKVKLYIHTLMPNIRKGNIAEKRLIYTNGKSVFKNINMKPIVQNTLYETNYIEADISNDSNLEILKTITEKYLGEKETTYIIPKGTNVRVRFLNGKLTKLSYYINSTSKINEKE